MARQNQYQLSETSLELLISRGYGGHLAQVSSGNNYAYDLFVKKS
jgi:hypothetical protein